MVYLSFNFKLLTFKIKMTHLKLLKTEMNSIWDNSSTCIKLYISVSQKMLINYNVPKIPRIVIFFSVLVN